MTIVCLDGKTLAADKQVTTGDFISSTIKIHRVQDGLLGLAGSACNMNEFLTWFQSGRSLLDFPSHLRTELEGVHALFIDKQKKTWIFQNSSGCYLETAKQVAIGSGADGALIAMFLGKTAVEAVKVVSKFYSSCGGGVDFLTLKV